LKKIYLFTCFEAYHYNYLSKSISRSLVKTTFYLDFLAKREKKNLLQQIGKEVLKIKNYQIFFSTHKFAK